MSSLSVTPPLALAAATVLPSLCGISVGLRFYIRRAQRLDFRLDDWLTVPPLILIIGMGAAIIAGVAVKGFAYPTPSPTDTFEDFASSNHVVTVTGKVAWALNMMDALALGFVKLSFVFFYRRIFAVGNRSQSFNILTILVNIVTVVWMMAFFFAYLFMCKTHFGAFWTSEQAVITHCGRITTTFLSFAVSDFAVDLVIFLLPIPMVWKLQMPLRRRLQTIAAFSVGGLAVLASILRMVAFNQANRQAFKPGYDYELVISTAMYWSMIELGLALIAACLPTMNYFLRRSSQAGTMRSNRGGLSFSQLRDDPTEDSVTERAAPFHGRSQSGQVEVYAMNDITPKRTRRREEGANKIWIDSTITQQRDMV